MIEFMFSNAECLSTANDTFEKFLELLEELISSVIVLWADWVYLTAPGLPNIFSLNFFFIIQKLFIFLFVCFVFLAYHLWRTIILRCVR